MTDIDLTTAKALWQGGVPRGVDIERRMWYLTRCSNKKET